MAHKYGSADKEGARIARGQKGVIKIGQLLDAGLSRNMVSDRVAKGTLHREYPGVYRVGHSAPSTEARYLAAVYASGDEARLSGFAAAYAYGVIKGKRPAPEVTTTANRRVRGVIVHRVRNLYPTDVWTYDGIPITTVARTLVDLAAPLPLAELSRACHEAEVKHRTTTTEVLETLARK